MEVAQASEASSFGKYTLVAKLATGGMAEIFLARLLSDGGFEKLVCIKRILPHLAKDPQFIAMFLDEARVVARISHPNVCQVFELGEISGQYYIAMEYLAGVPLSCFRRRDYYPAPPDPRLVAGFGVQACEGLHHAHQLKAPNGELLGVVHRDISPQNLFVTLDGIVKVLDFGIAKVQDQSVRTSTGAVKGTYCYMSPEQLRGEKVDRRADVWSLGTVLWESLAQRHLFKRETEFLTFQAITQDLIPDICEIRPDVPPLVGDVISRAVSRDREMRFPSARALGEALAQAVGPLGGAMTAAQISGEIEHAFNTLLEEQRNLLEMARQGDTFDLERSNPLTGGSLGTTPVSNIRSKLVAAQAEVAQYVQAQNAIRAIEDDEPSASGFTPPPGPGWTDRRSRPQAIVQGPERRSRPQAVLQGPERRSQSYPAQRRSQPYDTQADADSQPYAIAPSEWRQRDSTPLPIQTPMTQTMPVQVPSSKLPWIIALVAVGVAGAAGAALYMTSQARGAQPVQPQPAPPPQVAQVPDPPKPVPPPPAAVPIDAAPLPATVPIDAAVAVVVPPDAAVPIATIEHVKPPPVHHDPVAPPVTGPPGFITIDSAPVYAVIFIDGKRYGETPLVHISVPPGKHSVRAVSPSGTSRSLSISIESGKTAPVRRIEW